MKKTWISTFYFNEIQEFTGEIFEKQSNNGGNSDEFLIKLSCNVQPFIQEDEEKKEISFVVKGKWEMEQLVKFFNLFSL